MSASQLITLQEYLTTLSAKNKIIFKTIKSIAKEVEPKIVCVMRFNNPFFDLNWRLFYLGVQVKDRKKDTMTIWFCQGVSVAEINPAMELIWEWQKEWLAAIRKLKIDHLADLETYHFKELLQVMVAHNKKHNTHSEFAQKRRGRRKKKK